MKKHRRLWIIDRDDRSIIAALAPYAIWHWIGNPLFQNERNRIIHSVRSHLGQELDCLLYARPSIEPNELAIAAGLVRGGGVIVLFKPLIKTGFQSYCLNRFKSYRNPPIQAIKPPDPLPFQLNSEQQKAKQAVYRVASGHPRRPLLILADRGRGKSTVLGQAAAEIIQSGRSVLLTAPHSQSVQIVLQHAQPIRLKFMTVDRILAERPAAHLLIIDEAAALPLPILAQLIQYYSRTVMASTAHGYEGSGQGLRLRLYRELDRIRPQWRLFKLKQPVRWSEGDPVEAWLNDLLLLDAESKCTAVQAPYHFNIENKRSLRNDPHRLRALFGLLLEAHYRTSLNDLAYLFDDPDLILCSVRQEQDWIAVALLAQEKPLSNELCSAIQIGQRRIQGHRIAQSLAQSIGLAEGLKLNGLRLVRIAVCPQKQRQGIGSALLDWIENWAKKEYDYLGSLFGAQVDLLRFWQKKAWWPIRLGYKKNARSGLYSALVFKPLSKPAQSLYQKARSWFETHFPLQLGAHFCDLPPDLVRQLIYNANYSLSADDRQRLAHFLLGQGQYLDHIEALRRLTLYAASQNYPQVDPLIQSVLQSQNRPMSVIKNSVRSCLDR